MNPLDAGAFLLPSRGRPDSVRRFIEAYESTGARAPIHLVLDADDPTLPLYPTDLPDPWSRFVLNPNPGRVLGITRWWLEAHPDLAWYGLLGDDVLPCTQEWDRLLVEAAGRDLLAYADDGFQGARLATHPVLGGDLVRAIGWLALDGLDHSFCDTVLHAIAEATGRLRYLPHVSLEHLHPLAGKALHDATYQFDDAERYDRDARCAQDWHRREMRGVVERVVRTLEPLHETPVEAAETTAPFVCILTPSHSRRLLIPYVLSLIETFHALQRAGIGIAFRFGTGSDIAMARAELQSEALFAVPQATHFLWIDDDMEWAGEDVVRLVRHGEDFVGVAGLSKFDRAFAFRWLPDECAKTAKPDDRGLVEVRWIGGAFVLVTRRALQQMIASDPNGTCAPPQKAVYPTLHPLWMHVFVYDGDRHGPLGEDFSFAERWRRTGGRVWLDTEVFLRHHGVHHALAGAARDVFEVADLPVGT